MRINFRRKASPNINFKSFANHLTPLFENLPITATEISPRRIVLPQVTIVITKCSNNCSLQISYDKTTKLKNKSLV